MKRKQKRLLKRIALSVLLYIVIAVLTSLVSFPAWAEILLFILPYLVAGYDVLLKAFTNIKGGHLFDENFLMCIATVGAFCIDEYLEAVFVMIFYQIGELFQSIAVGRSRRSISALMDIRPDEARVIRDGDEVVVSPEEVEIGETVVVRAGEKIPLDGIVTEGAGELNCMALTGESAPRYIEQGMKAVGGCVNLTGTIKIEATSKYENSTVAKILELVENASSLKAKADRFITRFALYYTPIVVISALLLFLIPSFITWEFSKWLGRALIFLVISCPCALVISVPLSYFGGIGAASRSGILIKGAIYLEGLAEVSDVVFDKTGTLTKGAFKVVESKALNGDENKLNAIAYALESNSNHPVAEAVKKYCKTYALPEYKSTEISEHAGMGVKARVADMHYLAGNARLMDKEGITVPYVQTSGSVIYVASDKELIGYYVVKDELKDNAVEAVKELKDKGVKRTVMLSGDRAECAAEIAEQIGIDKAIGELMPHDKVYHLERILENKENKGKLVYVGDGINDAPVLSRADIGVSMGAMGSDAAIEAADVVLMDDDPMKLVKALEIATATKRIVIENIVFALGIKLAFMILGAYGIANLWTAVFADVGVAVIAILNAMRTLKLK